MNHEEASKLNHDLKIVALTVSNQIQSKDQGEYVRQCIPTFLKLLVVVPLIAILVQLFRWATGVSAGWFFSWPSWIVLTVAFPLAWLFARVLTRQVDVSRHHALSEADRQIGSSERIATAASFLEQPVRDGFMQAAVEDAAEWTKIARMASFNQKSERGTGALRSLWSIPIAISCLMLAAFLTQFARPLAPEESTLQAITAIAEPISVAIEPPPQEQNLPEKEQPEEILEKEPPPQQRSQKTVNRQGSSGAAIPDQAEESQGRLSEGETRESQQSANPSSARGAPSTSGQPSKSGEETKKKAKPKPKKNPGNEHEKKNRPQEEKPSGATAGQGSSKGSDNNAAPSDWASTSQAATPDDKDVEDEEDVADEEEEQESRGGVQPNMRDRRTPVNRDLQIGFGNARPNPDANGRGGPSGQKKSRGVASLVLGVPIPDRVNGQPNKGRIRITQQRITPEAEQSDPVAAQDRPTRQGSLGPIHHPDFSPWLQDLVRRYFLQRRAQTPLTTPANNPSKTNPEESTTSTTPKESLQTSIAPESNTPQS